MKLNYVAQNNVIILGFVVNTIESTYVTTHKKNGICPLTYCITTFASQLHS